MSGDHNIIIVGHLGKDPEMRFNAKGTAVTTFSVATSRSYMKDNEKIEQTTWFRVTAWGKLAEACNEYLHKGSLVKVDGRMMPGEDGNPRIWIGERDSKPHTNFDVFADTVTFLTTPDKGNKEQLPAVAVNPDEEVWK